MSNASLPNQIVLAARIISRDAVRFTPGGVPCLLLKLHHQSTQQENGHEVTVDLEIEAVAFGELADRLDALKVNDTLIAKGYLGRKNRFNSTAQLHITQFKFSE